MPKKSNKKINKNENENENENENNILLKSVLNTKILKEQKSNYIKYRNNFLKCGGVVSLAY